MDLYKYWYTHDRLAYLLHEPTSLENIYVPQHHLYPMHPQVLHHLMIELFVRAPLVIPTQEDRLFELVSSGPVFRVGWMAAALWKYILRHKGEHENVVLIAPADLPPDIDGIITEHDWLHSFFGILPVAKEQYASGFLQSAQMFSLYAKDIEAHIPYMRAYKNISVVPYIVNANREQVAFDDMLDAIVAHHWDTAHYVLVENTVGKEKIEEYLSEIE